MKTLCILLSVFFTTLLALPCDDAYSHGGDQGLDINLHLENNTDHGDMCSVFCTCSCCGVVTTEIQEYSHIIIKPVVRHTSKITDFQQLSLSRIPFGIWQPPKI